MKLCCKKPQTLDFILKMMEFVLTSRSRRISPSCNLQWSWRRLVEIVMNVGINNDEFCIQTAELQVERAAGLHFFERLRGAGSDRSVVNTYTYTYVKVLRWKMMILRLTNGDLCDSRSFKAAKGLCTDTGATLYTILLVKRGSFGAHFGR